MSFDGYIRVSRVGGREGDSFQSPDVQRAAIERYAESKGVKVVFAEPELDVSGSKLRRPILDGIMERIRSGESEGIIVSKVDRLSRAGLGDTIALVEDMQRHGGKAGFADLDMDTVSPSGEFALNIWLSVARYLWRQYQQSWAMSIGNAVERGVFIGAPPFGYTRDAEGRLAVDEEQADKVRRAFELAEAGGANAALTYLREAFPTRVNGKGETVPFNWSITVAERFLQRRLYGHGEFTNGEHTYRSDDLAIVDRYRWELAQPATRDVKRRPRHANVYPLAGIATCAACGSHLWGQGTTNGTRGARRYRCTSRTCTDRALMAAGPLETYVLDFVRATPPSVNSQELLQRGARVLSASAAVEQHLAKREAVEALDDRDLMQAWRKGLAEREEALEAARRADREVTGEMPDLDGDVTLEDMRLAFERAVASCAVSRGGRGKTAERVALALRA